MNAEQIIVRKRDGYELSENELRFVIEGFVNDEIPDYQMAALLMAIYYQDMSFEETFLLTKLMIESGRRVDFSHLDKLPVDKHSTGGVGDKVSIILAPLVAAAGVTLQDSADTICRCRAGGDRCAGCGAHFDRAGPAQFARWTDDRLRSGNR